MTSFVRGNRFESRQAIEALRNGVPNSYAVSALGSGQAEIEGNFVDMLAKAAGAHGAHAESASMLAAGDFGSGKSHLLQHLETVAHGQNFACSRVVVSKETPLFDLAKMFSAAVQHGRLPDIAGHMMDEASNKLDTKSEAYDEFFQWVNENAESGLHKIFAASLMVKEHDSDLDRSAAIERFWAGDRINVSEVIPRTGGYRVETELFVPRAKGGRIRLRNIHASRSELLKAAGYRGWVILIDELELVSNYTILQRGRSYAEIARWMGQTGESSPGLVVVGMTTPDLYASIVSEQGRNDLNTVPARLRAWKNPGSEITATRAETGMRLLQRIDANLQEPDEEMLAGLYEKLRASPFRRLRMGCPRRVDA